jgi:hypothetical protein
VRTLARMAARNFLVKHGVRHQGPRTRVAPRRAAAAIALLGAGACSTPGGPVDPDTLPWGRGQVYAGGFAPNIDSTVAVGEDEAGAGIELDVEEVFGLDTSNVVLRAGASVRVGETRRHQWELDYLSILRSASKTLEQDVTIDGDTYPAGTEVSTDFDISVIRAGYAYSFYLDERVDLAAGFGLYALPIDLDFDGIANSSSSSFTAPLPTIGLSMDVALQDNLFLRQRLDLFYLEVGQFEGAMADALLGLEWRPWEHVGFGLAYNRFEISVEATDEDYPEIDFVGDLDYRYNGFLLYLTYAF